MVNKLSAVILVSIFLLSPVMYAAASDLVILPKEEIVKISDEKLIDAYMDTVVEIEATRSFHATSGFTPKQFTEYKDLLKYKMRLLMEIHSRNVDVPQLDR